MTLLEGYFVEYLWKWVFLNLDLSDVLCFSDHVHIALDLNKKCIIQIKLLFSMNITWAVFSDVKCTPLLGINFYILSFLRL